MEFTELESIKAFHSITGITVKLYDRNLDIIKIFNSKAKYDVDYELSDYSLEFLSKESGNIWYKQGKLKEVFIFIRHQNNIISVGPFLTSIMSEEELEKFIYDYSLFDKYPKNFKKIFEYYSGLVMYGSGDLSDIVVLLGSILKLDLEEFYMDKLNTEYSKNEKELLRFISIKKIEHEKCLFYFENKILEFVAKGDVELLKLGVRDFEHSIVPKEYSNSLRKEKNYAIIFMEKLFLLALQLGNDVIQTVHLRDFYIEKIEEKKEVFDVLAVRDSAIIHFTEEIHKISPNAHSSFINSVIQYMNLKLYDSYKISDLCAHFFISESALRRQFKKEVGMSLNEYTNRRKITLAKAFLKAGIPVKECSKRLGFFDSSHFYKTFKKYEGITPTQFVDENISDFLE